MPVIAVRIPQIGEGLQEARLIAVLKQPGDSVKRDEPIYQMETDKAVLDVESPYEGVLVEWLAPVDAVLPIGGPVAKMEVADGVKEMEVHGGSAEAEPEAVPESAKAAEPAAARATGIPPRTRAYAKEKGISDDVLVGIPSVTGKLMPSDIDAYLAGGSAAVGATVAAKSGSGVGGAYTENAIGQKQRILNSRLVRGNQLVVPGTISCAVNWEPIENERARLKAKGGDFQPSSFTMFAYAVAKTLAEHPSFRTTLVGDNTLRTYDHVSLGIAVALPGDELVIAVVEQADTLTWTDFAAQARAKIELARNGQDQANEAVTISLTNMQNYGLRDAVPVVVPPSVATLFLGEVYNGLAQDTTEMQLRRYANLGLTFDHRVINGAGAAQFLAQVKQMVETISQHLI